MTNPTPLQKTSIYYPFLLRFIIGLLLLYVLYVAVLFVLQRQILFPGQYIAAPPSIVGTHPDMIRVTYQISDGLVETFYIPAHGASPENPAPLLIYTHGNGELIDPWVRGLARFRSMGISLLLVEYPGYGRSAGSPSQRGIEAVLLSAYDYMITRPEVDATQIIAYGQSVGGGPASILAAKRPIAALILHSTFTSIRDLSKKYVVPSFLILDPFDNQAIVQKYPGPVLILHGTYDDLIPVSHAETLAQSAAQATLITYPCGHNNCPADREQFWADVTSFLQDINILLD